MEEGICVVCVVDEVGSTYESAVINRIYMTVPDKSGIRARVTLPQTALHISRCM